MFTVKLLFQLLSLAALCFFYYVRAWKIRCNPPRQSSDFIHSLIFAFFYRNSMRLKLFGFPDESPHAIPGPDDFCITKMMWLGLMELTVSRGISHHSPKMVYRSRVRPLTQCSTKVLSQQSHKNRKRGGRMEMAIKCSQKKKNEWVCLSAKEKTDKRMKFTKRFCFFFCLLDKSQEILLRLFFPVGFTLIPPFSHFI